MSILAETETDTLKLPTPVPGQLTHYKCLQHLALYSIQLVCSMRRSGIAAGQHAAYNPFNPNINPNVHPSISHNPTASAPLSNPAFPQGNPRAPSSHSADPWMQQQQQGMVPNQALPPAPQGAPGGQSHRGGSMPNQAPQAPPVGPHGGRSQSDSRGPPGMFCFCV